jgi:hypothetical protein
VQCNAGQCGGPYHRWNSTKLMWPLASAFIAATISETFAASPPILASAALISSLVINPSRSLSSALKMVCAGSPSTMIVAAPSPPPTLIPSGGALRCCSAGGAKGTDGALNQSAAEGVKRRVSLMGKVDGCFYQNAIAHDHQNRPVRPIPFHAPTPQSNASMNVKCNGMGANVFVEVCE